MIDLFVWACVLSRVNTSVADKGARAATKELELLRVFGHQATQRIRANFDQMDANDDEGIQSLANHALELAVHVCCSRRLVVHNSGARAN